MEFTVKVIRHRYTRESEFGRPKVESDRVLIDVNERGEYQATSWTPPEATTHLPAGCCYEGWKRLTGIPLHPMKVYTVKFTAEIVGAPVKVAPHDVNQDLDPEAQPKAKG